MSTKAIALLKQEETDQTEKLKALLAEHKPAIEAGKRAQRIVNAQQDHVNEIVEGILTLESAYKAAMREVSDD